VRSEVAVAHSVGLDDRSLRRIAATVAERARDIERAGDEHFG
jgi:hypothetical protein